MCPSQNNNKIGTLCMIKWTDGHKYKAKLLKRGSKLK